MHIFYYPDIKNINIQSSKLFLPDDEYSHARNSLRMKCNDEFTIFDGAGGIYKCVATNSSGKDNWRGEFQVIDEKYESPILPNITIICSIFKYDRLEFAIEKLAEIGVAEIVLTQTRYSQFDLKTTAKKLDRFERIIVSAIKQSQNPFAPSISVLSLDEIYSKYKNVQDKFVASTEISECKSLKDLHSKATDTQDIVLFIGPEGGFEKDELNNILQNNFKAVSLGSTILRAETAAIVGAGFLKI